jgi:tetratricopeptide (TPR) repeat protein
VLPAGVSNSLGKLRALRDSFALPAGEKRAVRLAEELGRTAVPLLSRMLRSPERPEAERAYRVMARLGGDRVVDEARALACDPGTGGDTRSLALALLAQLGADPPPDVAVEDVEALRDASVRDLVGALVEPADVARAADLILEEVPAAELVDFVTDLAEVGGSDVSPVVDELLLRDDVAAEAAASLRSLRQRLGDGAAPAKVPCPARRRMWSAARADGARAVLVTSRLGDRRPARLRAMTAIVDAGGKLASVRYEPELAPRGGVKRLQHALIAAGYLPCATHSVDEAARRVGDAARATRPLPRGYYLGRDLLGLSDEHARPAEDATASHYWNLAYAAKVAGRLGACYEALLRYLEAQDDEEGASGRARAARSYLRLYEKYARLEHPETTAALVARAEELFERAYRHLAEGHIPEAMTGFDAVLTLVPSHYPSWANLGVAHASLSHRAEAERCLRRALTYRPDYDVALRNLEALDG